MVGPLNSRPTEIPLTPPQSKGAPQRNNKRYGDPLAIAVVVTSIKTTRRRPTESVESIRWQCTTVGHLLLLGRT